MNTRTIAARLAVLCLLPSLNVSLAHIGFTNTSVVSGSTQLLTLKVPHGCGELATQMVKVNVPVGIDSVKPMPKPDWKIKLQREAAPQADHIPSTSQPHNMTSARITSIEWSGGNLPSDYYDQFSFQAKINSTNATLPFVIEQNCGSQSIIWSAPSHDDPHPAAVLSIQPAAPQAHPTHH